MSASTALPCKFVSCAPLPEYQYTLSLNRASNSVVPPVELLGVVGHVPARVPEAVGRLGARGVVAAAVLGALVHQLRQHRRVVLVQLVVELVAKV